MRSYKRLIALIMTLILPVMMVTGCSKKPNPEDLKDNNQLNVTNGLPDSFENVDNAAYVLVYNPGTYNDYSDSNGDLATGDFDQNVVDTSAVRAGELPNVGGVTITPRAQGQAGFEEFELSENRAGFLITPYSVGDKREFFYDEVETDTRTSDTFVCRYAGEHCYIWTIDGATDVTDDQAKECGTRFDNDLYEQEVEMFGDPRYAEDGGKINLLLYDFNCTGQSIVLGYFSMYDLAYTSADLTEADIQKHQVNVDHAIIHVNSFALQNPDYEDYAYSTMAHEFQHLLFGSSILCEADPEFYFNVWLNEALSGYVEEVFYPGIKESDLRCLENSDKIRHGQSLYNFASDDGDIGVYGSVFLFSEFIKELGGDQVFSNIHNYLRTTTDSNVTDENALYEALGPDVVDKINGSIVFPDNISFGNEKEEFTSKLTLAFYMSMLNGEFADLSAYGDLDKSTLLYDELDGCRIQGGGRVLLATKDGKFTIPDGADSGLVFIGLDENFKPVTSIIGK